MVSHLAMWVEAALRSSMVIFAHASTEKKPSRDSGLRHGRARTACHRVEMDIIWLKHPVFVRLSQELGKSGGVGGGAQMDLNHRPLPYQGSALTKLSYGPEIACRDYPTPPHHVFRGTANDGPPFLDRHDCARSWLIQTDSLAR